jgi:predicted deacylase
MLPTSTAAAHRATVYKKTSWLRVPPGAAGMFLTTLKPGDEVKQGDTLGKVVDPLSDEETPILSPSDGVIIGMEKPNVVYSGDALFHLGLEKLAP